MAGKFYNDATRSPVALLSSRVWANKLTSTPLVDELEVVGNYVAIPRLRSAVTFSFPSLHTNLWLTSTQHQAAGRRPPEIISPPRSPLWRPPTFLGGGPRTGGSGAHSITAAEERTERRSVGRRFKWQAAGDTGREPERSGAKPCSAGAHRRAAPLAPLVEHSGNRGRPRRVGQHGLQVVGAGRTVVPPVHQTSQRGHPRPA